MIIEKKRIAYIISILIGTGTYAIWNLKERRKLTKRIKRNKAFLAESEAIMSKYREEPEDGGKQMVREFLDLMEKYEI